MKKVLRSHTKKLTGIRAWQDDLRRLTAAPLVEKGSGESGGGGGVETGNGIAFGQGDAAEGFQVVVPVQVGALVTGCPGVVELVTCVCVYDITASKLSPPLPTKSGHCIFSSQT